MPILLKSGGVPDPKQQRPMGDKPGFLPSDTWLPKEISETGLGALFDGLDAPFVVYRADGTRLYANEATARLYFYPSVAAFMADDHRQLMERLEIFGEDGKVLRVEDSPAWQAVQGRPAPGRLIGIRLKETGETHWATLKASPRLGPDGKVRFVIAVMEDVTAIKQSQIDLTRTRDDQAAMLRLMETACTAQDATGRLVFANEAAVRWLGFPDEETLLRTDVREVLNRFEVLDAEHRPFDRQRLPGRRALLGETVRGEVMCYRVRATGKEYWSMVNASPVFDRDGKVRLAINVFTDITEVRRAEASVQKHMRYLEGLNRVSGAIQRTLDVERVLPAALARLLEVFECDRAWLIQKADGEGYRIPFYAERSRAGAVQGTRPTPDRIPPQAGFDEIAQACQATEDALVFGREHPMPHPEYWREELGVGSIKAVSVRPQVGRPWILCLLRPPSEEAWRGEDLAMFQEIGMRIATALGAMILYRDLRRSEEKHRTLFERSLDGIYRIGVDGAVLDANPALVAMLGHADRAELIGTRLPLLLPAGGALPADRNKAEGGETFAVELARRDGSPVWVEVNAQAIRRQSGEIAYFEGIVRNINDRKRAEEALKASEEKLRQAQKMEAVGRLAGGVAHDFNNLLTAINGFSDLLLMSIDKDDARRGHLEEIRKAGARAAALTSQLLSFSRKQVLAPRVLDLNAVVKGMETMLRRLIGEDVAFSTDLDPGLKRVVADPNQMEQVILNLVLNARDAMPDGGELRLTTANRSLREGERAAGVLDAPAGEYAMLRVKDTGTGMDPETQARLFEPFFTTKQKDKGTGLGLSTVYGAVKQANGAITVESAPGLGSTFSIFLPEAARQARAPDRERLRERVVKTAGGTETILLVEDEDAVRRLARDVLEVAGYKVHEAPGGEQALELAERLAGTTIHLLLTDVVMGGISGRELAERLKAKRPETRVLFMSGYTEDAIIRHGVYTAQAAFIGKPFSPAALTAKVREVLDAVEAKPAN
jgi:PAS domain S-box-containing protein